jgi:hypothetical protein
MQPADIAKVCVFDWGRSELNTPELYNEMEEDTKEERQRYWKKWQRPLFRCLFEATSLYVSQFFVRGVNDRENARILISVWDYDTYDPSDLLGYAEIPLEETEEEVPVKITDAFSGQMCACNCQPVDPYVYVTVRREHLPQGSRLQEAWSVYVHSVEGLPKADVFSDTDPLVRVDLGGPRSEHEGEAEYHNPGMRASGQTPVVYDDRNAEIDHTLLFGVVENTWPEKLLQTINKALATNFTVEDFLVPDGQDADDYRIARNNGFEDFVANIPAAQSIVGPIPNVSLCDPKGN